MNTDIEIKKGEDLNIANILNIPSINESILKNNIEHMKMEGDLDEIPLKAVEDHRAEFNKLK